MRISDDFCCAGQPTAEEFVDVQRSGVRLVVNLAMPDSDFALPDEQVIVESLGMDFVHIPVPFSAPSVEHFLHFERELRSRQGQPVLVHCALNWRASSFMALYSERNLGWTREQSEQIRCALWSPDSIWNDWAESIRTPRASEFKIKQLSVGIKRPPSVVYDFVRSPENLPRWASGIGSNPRREGERWIIDMPDGPVEIRFVEKNELGVLDHFVTAGDGTVFFNPMRVVPNNLGSEVSFSVFQFPGVSDEQFLTDAETVSRDLQALKALLEAQAP